MNIRKITQKDKPLAVVLGKYITGGLGAVRNLGRNNIPVIWIDSTPNQIGFLTKYCHRIKSPHPKFEPEKYIKLLIELGEKLTQKGVIIPLQKLCISFVSSFF